MHTHNVLLYAPQSLRSAATVLYCPRAVALKSRLAVLPLPLRFAATVVHYT